MREKVHVQNKFLYFSVIFSKPTKNSTVVLNSGSSEKQHRHTTIIIKLQEKHQVKKRDAKKLVLRNKDNNR